MPQLLEQNRHIPGTKCKAILTIADPDLVNRWVIIKCIFEHNHELTLDSSDLISTYHEIPIHFRKELEING